MQDSFLISEPFLFQTQNLHRKASLKQETQVLLTLLSSLGGHAKTDRREISEKKSRWRIYFWAWELKTDNVDEEMNIVWCICFFLMSLWFFFLRPSFLQFFIWSLFFSWKCQKTTDIMRLHLLLAIERCSGRALTARILVVWNRWIFHLNSVNHRKWTAVLAMIISSVLRKKSVDDAQVISLYV